MSEATAREQASRTLRKAHLCPDTVGNSLSSLDEHTKCELAENWILQIAEVIPRSARKPEVNGYVKAVGADMVPRAFGDEQHLAVFDDALPILRISHAGKPLNVDVLRVLWAVEDVLLPAHRIRIEFVSLLRVEQHETL